MQTSERRIHYTRLKKYSNKFFLDSKILHLIQWEKFTPLSATKGQLSYQHWKSEKISYTFIASVDLDSYPFHNIFLRIQEDTSIDIPWVKIQTGRLLYFRSRDSCHKRSKKKEKLKWKKKQNTEISKNRFVTHLRATIIRIGISCQVTVVFQMSGVI